MRLPSGRTITDYMNSFSPETGWQPSYLSQIKESAKAAGVFDTPGGNIVTMAFDEMKIQKGLVFRRSTNELVGFADLDLWESNANHGSDYRPALATHATQFFITTVDSRCAFNAPVAYLYTRENKQGKDILINKMIYDGLVALHLVGFEVRFITSDNANENSEYYISEVK